jgi:hypothetical protein
MDAGMDDAEASGGYFPRNWLEEDKLREECGVFGVFNHADASALTVLGLHALQHRGQEAAGIVTSMASSTFPNGVWDWSARISPASRSSTG